MRIAMKIEAEMRRCRGIRFEGLEMEGGREVVRDNDIDTPCLSGHC